MVRVKKANAEYRVSDEKLEEYLELGYSQIDENGGVLREGARTERAALKEENAALKEENAALKGENAAYRIEIQRLQSENAALNPSHTEAPPTEDLKPGKKGS